MGVARRLLNMRSILHLHGLRHLRTRNPCPRRPLHPRAPARRSQKRHRWRHRPRRRLSPLRPNRLLRSPRPSPLPRLRPSHPTWPRPLGCAPTTLPAPPLRASSRPSPRPERPSARPSPWLSRLRRLRHGNPSRCPTTMLWSVVLLPMPAGTICPRSTCRVRRPRPRPLLWHPQPLQTTTSPPLPGNPIPVLAAPSAIRAQPRASRRPRMRPRPSSAASSVSPPSSSRWSNRAGGYAAQEEISLPGRICISDMCNVVPRMSHLSRQVRDGRPRMLRSIRYVAWLSVYSTCSALMVAPIAK